VEKVDQELRERMLQLAQNRDEPAEKVVERATAYEKFVKGSDNGEA
jgi:predicted transcriptional regulator